MARGVAGVLEDDGLPALEFRPQWLEIRVCEVFPGVAGHQDDAVGVQRSERILNFGQGALDVGERQRREGATLGVLTDRIPVAICWESMKSMARSGDQSGVTLPEGSPPWLARACA
jgi:hypothetical protein